jgi:hypothetical protein
MSVIPAVSWWPGRWRRSRRVSVSSWPNVGYAPRSAVDLLHVMAQLSRWLDEQHLDPGGLTGEAIDRFVVDRREKYRKRLWESGFERLRTSLYYIPRS